MRKILAAGFASLAVFSLAACGGSDEPTPTKTVYVQPDNSSGGSDGEGQQQGTENAFLSDVAENMSPDLHSTAQSDVVDLGRAYCNALDNDASVEQVLEVAINEGVNPQDAGVILAAAVIHFCPEHQGQVRDFLNRYGYST